MSTGYSRAKHRGDETLIQTLCLTGQLDKAVDLLFRMPHSPADRTYMLLLRACIRCKGCIQAKRIHAHLSLSRTHLSGFLGGYLVLTLAKSGAIADAHLVSERLPSRSVFTWTSLILAHADCGEGLEALNVHRRMVKDNIEPNCYTFVGLFKACGIISDVAKGKEFHALAGRLGFQLNNVHLGTALLSMYEKCGAVHEAEVVFVALSERNSVSWNVMLSVYVKQGQGKKALQLFRQMQEEGGIADDRAFLFAIKACSILASQLESEGISIEIGKQVSFEIGKALHRLTQAKGFTADVFIGTALLRMYSKCSALAEAEEVFCALPYVDMVSWTAMITMYAEQGQGQKALDLYTTTQAELVALDDITLICILQACNDQGSMGVCRKLHFDISSMSCDENPSVSAALINAYGHCGGKADACVVFDKHSEMGIALWNACIAMYARCGDTTASLCLFEKLKRVGSICPDAITFTMILSACCHMGLIHQGTEYFEAMTRDYGIVPSCKHYSIMVDLLGHGGDFERLMSILESMPVQADLTIWLNLLDACAMHGNIELAKRAFLHAVDLQPKHATAYFIMSKMYADAGLHEHAAKVLDTRLRGGLLAHHEVSYHSGRHHPKHMHMFKCQRTLT